METSTETTRVRTGFAMPHPLAVIDESRRNGREIIGYRAFRLVDDGVNKPMWEQVSYHTPVNFTEHLNKYEQNGWLLSPSYADEVK